MNELGLFFAEEGYSFAQITSFLGWAVAGIITAVSLLSGIWQNVSGGRKELLEISDKRIENLEKENSEYEKDIIELESTIESLRKELIRKEDECKHEINKLEREKVSLLREHHQLLEYSVKDLNTIRENVEKIEFLESELRKYKMS